MPYRVPCDGCGKELELDDEEMTTLLANPNYEVLCTTCIAKEPREITNEKDEISLIPVDATVVAGDPTKVH